MALVFQLLQKFLKSGGGGRGGFGGGGGGFGGSPGDKYGEYANKQAMQDVNAPDETTGRVKPGTVQAQIEALNALINSKDSYPAPINPNPGIRR